MSLTTTAPLILPTRQSVSYEDRPYTSHSQGASTSTYYTRPTSSQGAPHGMHRPDPVSPPERLHSSHGYISGPTPTPQTPSYTHDPSAHAGYPATPLTGPAYPSHPASGSYYGITQTQTPSEPTMPSPPPTSDGRQSQPNFTPDGNPIVPVGISGGKMFQCRGYGECDKVFTRSEHLARHVR